MLIHTLFGEVSLLGSSINVCRLIRHSSKFDAMHLVDHLWRLCKPWRWADWCSPHKLDSIHLIAFLHRLLDAPPGDQGDWSLLDEVQICWIAAERSRINLFLNFPNVDGSSMWPTVINSISMNFSRASSRVGYIKSLRTCLCERFLTLKLFLAYWLVSSNFPGSISVDATSSSSLSGRLGTIWIGLLLSSKTCLRVLRAHALKRSLHRQHWESGLRG